MRISPLNNKMTTLGVELQPEEYSSSKIVATRLNEIIVVYGNILLNSIPEDAIKKIKSAINPDNFSKKYEPQVFVALEKFEKEKLDFFKEDIITGLKLVINRSTDTKLINRAIKILSESYSISYNINNTLEDINIKLNKTLSYQEKRDELCDLVYFNLESNSLTNNNFKQVIINDLLKITKNINGKKIKITNLDLIKILKDIYNENPEFLSKNFIEKKKGFSISKDLEILINDYVLLNENNVLRESSFPELQSLSVEYSISENKLLDIIIFNNFYTKETKLVPITGTKCTSFKLDNKSIVIYMQYIGKINNIEN